VGVVQQMSFPPLGSYNGGYEEKKKRLELEEGEVGRGIQMDWETGNNFWGGKLLD